MHLVFWLQWFLLPIVGMLFTNLPALDAQTRIKQLARGQRSFHLHHRVQVERLGGVSFGNRFIDAAFGHKADARHLTDGCRRSVQEGAPVTQVGS